jgi:hypothetical protein
LVFTSQYLFTKATDSNKRALECDYSGSTRDVVAETGNDLFPTTPPKEKEYE